MGAGVLNPAGERDGRAFGQCGGVKIDLEVGQLPADARIEGAVGLGLRERQARRPDRAGEQCGERAAIDDHDCSSLCKACFLLSNAWSASCTSNLPLAFDPPLFSSSSYTTFAY